MNLRTHRLYECNMANCVLHVCFSVTLILMLSAAIKSETRVETTFTTNPVVNGSQTGFQCKIWELGQSPSQQVGISRLIETNGRNSQVLVRDGVLLATSPDNILLTRVPGLQSDGSVLYLLAVVPATEEDAGSYSCSVWTISNGEVMAAATDSSILDVTTGLLTTQPPDVYLPPDGYPVCSMTSNRLSFFAGEDITLVCSSVNGKPSISLLWIRNEDIPVSQTDSEQGGMLYKNTTIKLKEEDNGGVFKCVIISEAFPSNGRECSIGPIAVWPAMDSTTVSMVSYNITTTSINTTSEFKPRLILGLSETVFAMIVVAASILFLITIILVFIFCVRSYSCSCIVRSRKQYNMQGFIDKEETLERGAGGTHTLRQSSVDPQFTPIRYAPVAPPSITTDSAVQKRYTPNASASTNNGGKRLSAVEAALLMAVTKSISRTQSSGSIAEEPEDGEIIYANTSRSSSMIELHKIGRNYDEEQDHEDKKDSDSDSGVVNPAYDHNESPSGDYAKEQTPPAAPRSRSASQSEIIYHNTASALPTNESDDRPTYAKVDKSRSRANTMESLKARSIVEPEAVTTLDDSVIYHNTAELGMDSLVFVTLPPPVPENPPSPTRKEPLKRLDYRKRAASLGGPEKPSFKPPPPPASPGPSVRPNSEIVYGNTGVGIESSEGGKQNTRPKIPPKPKPVPPKKPTYKI